MGVLALLAGCGSQVGSNTVNKDDVEEEVDETAPLIVHDPVEGTQTFGVDVPISATVTDEESGILFVTLYYKTADSGSADWQTLQLIPSGDVYSGTIPGEDESGSGMDYYLSAVDKAQNYAYDPEDGEDDPHRFRVAE